MICVLKLCYALRQTHVLMTCTCNCSMHISPHATACSMHIQHMQLLHAHSAPARTRSGSPHNVLHSSSARGLGVYYVRTSLSDKLLPADQLVRTVRTGVQELRPCKWHPNWKRCNVSSSRKGASFVRCKFSPRNAAVQWIKIVLHKTAK